MKINSHFTFSKQQRNGVFLLLILIISLQIAYFYVESQLLSSSDKNDIVLNSEGFKAFEAELDSLRQAKIEHLKPKLFPFNPNFITDFKGYNLGMTSAEIDRLLQYRKQNKWINSAQEFQKITKVSDSLLAVLSPNFKFPDWVVRSKRIKTSKTRNHQKEAFNLAKADLNSASASQLKLIVGVGDKLSQRIIEYREKINGFASSVELQEIYGLSSDVIKEINKSFTIKRPRSIDKINLNTATRDHLVTIRYIDYEVAHQIIEYRTLHAGFKSLDDLLKVKDFPLNKYEIIKLYLQLD